MPAILREISVKTSYQMVRLVFRPYRQVWRAICTSATLRASIRVSSDFTLLTHSSPSFGSQRYALTQIFQKNIQIGQWCSSSPRTTTSHFNKSNLSLLSFCIHKFFHFHTRIFVRHLGPCYKTGRLKPLC